MRIFVTFLVLSAGLISSAKPAEMNGPTQWKEIVKSRIPVFGHRNWIVVADSAYPAQTRDGIETVVTGTDQMSVLQFVLAQLSASKHVRPIILTDTELKYLSDADAAGIEGYRQQLAVLSEGSQVQSLPHEEIISKLDKTAQTFRILILKTNMTIPYTSAFLQLDCAYWGPEAEQKLRAKMARKPAH